MNLEEAAEAHKGLAALKVLAAEAEAERNAAIIAAHEEGVTAYRIAKALGIAESTVGIIIKRSQA